LKALINVRIYDYKSYHDKSYVIFDEIIRGVGPMNLFKKEGIDEIIDCKNSFVLPGFVCGHTHLYSAFARGMSIPFNPTSFKEVLEQMWWKLDHFLDLDMIYHSAFSFGLDQIKNGSTTLIDHHASGTITNSLKTIKKALVDDLGIRSILAFETSDRFNVDESVIENKSFIEKYKDNRVAGTFGLHASFTLSDKTLAKVKENLNNAGIHIHVAESIKDEEDSITKYGKTVIKRLDDFGLINNKSILVHCAHVTDKELAIIKKRDAYVAINVTSNMNNAVGLPNIKQMKDLGIKIIIGNDGLIQSMPIEYLNAYYTAHLKTKNPIGFSLDGIKEAILMSYEYVSKLLEIKLGEIKEGFVSDLLVVPYDEFTPLDKNNIFGQVFFGMFPGFKPKHVIANGKFIVKEYQVSEEFNDKNLEAKKEAERLWKIIIKEGSGLKFNS